MSKKFNILDGNMVWVVMFGVALCGWWSTLYITDGSDPSNSSNPDMRYHPLQQEPSGEECEMRAL